MKEAFQNADNSSDNEKQKNVSEERSEQKYSVKSMRRGKCCKRETGMMKPGFFAPALLRMQKLFMHRAESALCRKRKCIP